MMKRYKKKVSFSENGEKRRPQFMGMTHCGEGRGGQRRRIPIRDILDDPEDRRELMISTIIATQAREGIEVTREQAERAYDKIQRELRREQNPGVAPIRRNDDASMAGAMQSFSRFHSREPGKGVFPFHKQEQGIFTLPEYVAWPDEIVAAGNAARTLYESDKWHKRGKTVQYFHDHDKGVKFIVPDDGHVKGHSVRLSYEWPDEVVLIGECIGFVFVPFETGEITEGVMKGKNVLVSSPDGWVDSRKKNRIFLAIINLDGGGVEAIIDGPNLRITSHGIEG
jgi:hypothetical protein